MAGRTPDPGGGRDDGPHDPDDRAGDPAPRAWLHPSELGARFDTPAAGIPAVPPAPEPDTTAPAGRAVRVLALAAAGLLLLVTGFGIGARLGRRDAPPAATAGLRTSADAFASLVDGAAPAQPVADAGHTATVMTTEGRSGAICVDGGVVTALEGVYGSGGIIVAAGRTAHRATVTAADPVSGLAYLTGVTCPNGSMDMPVTAAPAAGSRVHVLARLAGSTGVRSTTVRVVSGAGRVEGARSGTAVVRASAVRSLRGASVLGAPVVTDGGELVGIVVGVGADGAHVVPTSMARRVIAQLVAGEPATAGWMGVRLDDAGAVAAVADGAPAQAAGVQPGDTIYAVDGHRTADADALLTVLQAHAPGDPITVTLERRGRTFDVDVTLASAPAEG